MIHHFLSGVSCVPHQHCASHWQWRHHSGARESSSAFWSSLACPLKNTTSHAFLSVIRGILTLRWAKLQQSNSQNGREEEEIRCSLLVGVRMGMERCSFCSPYVCVADLQEIVFGSKYGRGTMYKNRRRTKISIWWHNIVGQIKKYFFLLRYTCGYVPNFILLGHVLHDKSSRKSYELALTQYGLAPL